MAQGLVDRFLWASSGKGLPSAGPEPPVGPLQLATYVADESCE
jgi:hypothetical protein